MDLPSRPAPHPTIEQPLERVTCEKCHKIFTSRNKLMRHVYSNLCSPISDTDKLESLEGRLKDLESSQQTSARRANEIEHLERRLANLEASQPQSPLESDHIASLESRLANLEGTCRYNSSLERRVAALETGLDEIWNANKDNHARLTSLEGRQGLQGYNTHRSLPSNSLENRIVAVENSFQLVYDRDHARRDQMNTLEQRDKERIGEIASLKQRAAALDKDMNKIWEVTFPQAQAG